MSNNTNRFTEADADEMLLSNDWAKHSDVRWLLMQVAGRVAAQFVADNAALRAEFARAATRLVVLGSQVKVLEDALRRVHDDKSFNCLKVEKTQDFVRAALGATK